MSINTDLKMAYHMGYDDALAKRKPDVSKVHMLRREMCDMVAQREADLEDAIMTENAKLREQGERLFDKVMELKTENDRLWELADYATPIAWYAASEHERDRMRELGVEID